MHVFVISKRALTSFALAVALLVASAVFVLYTSGGSVQVLGKKDDIPIYSVKTSGKQVAITFDAAWGTDKTVSLLDILDKYNIKATFFVTGMWADKNPEVLKEIARRGHEIGSHSYTHRDMVKMSDADVVTELNRTADALERITGKRPTAFRAPYGSWNTKLVDIVGREQYDFFQWDVDSLDWKGLSAAEMENRVMSRVVSGSILLFHNDGAHTPEVMPTIIEQLQEKGFKPVTVTELLGETLEASKN